MRRLLAWSCACSSRPALHATVIVPAEFREVVPGPELIAYGRVVDVQAQWADDRRRIDSVVTVDVLSWFKGGTDGTVAFVVPGGEIGRYRQRDDRRAGVSARRRGVPVPQDAGRLDAVRVRPQPGRVPGA